MSRNSTIADVLKRTGFDINAQIRYRLGGGLSIKPSRNADYLERTGIDINAEVDYEMEIGKLEAEVFDDFRCWASASRDNIVEWMFEAATRLGIECGTRGHPDVARYFGNSMILTTHQLFRDWLWTYKEPRSMGYGWIYKATDRFRTPSGCRFCEMRDIRPEWRCYGVVY